MIAFETQEEVVAVLGIGFLSLSKEGEKASFDPFFELTAKEDLVSLTAIWR